MKIKSIKLLTALLLVLSVTKVNALTTDYTTTRLSGQDRFDTAIEVSKEFAKKDTIINCIIGNSDNYADNISATPLSVYKNAPILLTEKDTLNPKTQKRLVDMGIKNVFIVGGAGAVSQNVENQLKALGYTVTRLGGSDRIATNRAIMNFIPKDVWGPYVKLINSYDWIEGLCVAADCKMVIDGKTYINPIFTINPNTSTVADIQDIVDVVKPLSSKWQGDYTLTIDESRTIDRNVDKRVECELGPIDPYELIRKISAARKDMYTCFASSNTTVKFIWLESDSIYNQDICQGYWLGDKYDNENVWRSWQISSKFSVKPDLEPRYVDYRVLKEYTSTLLTRQDNFIDALSAAPLAAKLSAPIILINSSNTPIEKEGYDIFTNVNKVYYIGGTNVVSDGSEIILK